MLKVYFLKRDAAKIIHPILFTSPFVDYTRDTVDVCIWAKKQHDIRGQFHNMSNMPIQKSGILFYLCNWRLHEHNIDVGLDKVQIIAFEEGNQMVHLIYFGVVQEKA